MTPFFRESQVFSNQSTHTLSHCTKESFNMSSKILGGKVSLSRKNSFIGFPIIGTEITMLSQSPGNLSPKSFGRIHASGANMKTDHLPGIRINNHPNPALILLATDERPSFIYLQPYDL
jgi:hypothetical protein